MTTRNEDCPSSSLRVSMDARELFPILYYTIYDLMTPYRIFNPSSTKFRISLEKFNHLINTRRACAARVTVLGSCVCVCLCAPFRPLRVKVSPENDTNASSRQDKEKKNGRFPLKCSVQKLWRHLLTLSAFGGLVGLFSSS